MENILGASIPKFYRKELRLLTARFESLTLRRSPYVDRIRMASIQKFYRDILRARSEQLHAGSASNQQSILD